MWGATREPSLGMESIEMRIRVGARRRHAPMKNQESQKSVAAPASAEPKVRKLGVARKPKKLQYRARESAYLFCSPEKDQPCARLELGLPADHAENTLAKAACRARAISAHSSDEIVTGGASSM